MLKKVLSSCFSPYHPSRFLIIKRGNAFFDYFQSSPPPTPPYGHVCQIGDPTLRGQAEPVEPEIVATVDFKKFVDHLISTMRIYEAYGLSAPQIGVSAQVFVIETTPKQVEECIVTKSAGQPVEVVPLTVFINPKMKILDYHTNSYPEACASVFGYIAHVPRAKSVQIEAFDVTGKKFKWKAEGWPAKVAQHEMDHLQGKLFTDKMDPQTLSCAIWSIVNLRRGKVAIKFFPDPGRWIRFKRMFSWSG
ncbi:peptide deformylase, mitochondrial [Diachasma alloeum]|uniref:peptide deformylase, mitochondrial n=1 Tax=Diachasma alloeum TaxID=454923 RepID=UPI00073822DF|nr:peptide deformylase, mitochondrial [Diachasma alloeum]